MQNKMCFLFAATDFPVLIYGLKCEFVSCFWFYSLFGKLKELIYCLMCSFLLKLSAEPSQTVKLWAEFIVESWTICIEFLECLWLQASGWGLSNTAKFNSMKVHARTKNGLRLLLIFNHTFRKILDIFWAMWCLHSPQSFRWERWMQQNRANLISFRN